MHQVLKFPLENVRRTTDSDSKREKNGQAEILLFTGVRYERYAEDDMASAAKKKEVAE